MSVFALEPEDEVAATRRRTTLSPPLMPLGKMDLCCRLRASLEYSP